MRGRPRFLTSVAASALLLYAGRSLPADPAQTTQAVTAPLGARGSSLPTITVEARRKLDREVSHYVSSIVVPYFNDSLMRWNTPVCPLVAGLPRGPAEFVLARISRIATAAHAPLGSEHCSANFYVVVTSDPDSFLKEWWRRDPRLFNVRNGMGAINHFLASRVPIRSWYNAGFASSEGGPMLPDGLIAGLYGPGASPMLQQVPTNRVPDGSRLRYSAVQSLSSVIIIVDRKQVGDFHMEQLADYITMIGLAEIRLDADLGEAPSILKLFQGSKDVPQGLSSWDQAFLYSLYNTGQASVMQTSELKTSMMKQIAPH